MCTGQGARGVELAHSTSPDVVVLDSDLPDMDGLEVLKQIRTFSPVPAIILSVKSERADVLKGLESGADDYLVKPFRQLELLARVQAQLPQQP